MNNLKRDFHTPLLQWYRSHGRTSLPWRNTKDAYAIYISEIMLQQTQVSTVLEHFYEPFLERFPTLQSLADAALEDVLHAWQGLGYYSRAANLHRAAQQAAPELPNDVEGLMALPGIGRNTAHAVAAFAFDAKVPVMEANLRRVLYRVFARTQATESDLWEMAGQLLDSAHSFDYNQAMMDLGATICKPRAPLCTQCPAQAICQGKSSPLSYPAPKTRTQISVRRNKTLVCRDADGRFYATARTTRLLGGLYEFPAVSTEADSITLGNVKIPFASAQRLGIVQQTYSHFTQETEVYLAQLATPEHGNAWYADLNALPVSGLERKILALLEEASAAKVRPRSKKRTEHA